jgi:hypothetical protein
MALKLPIPIIDVPLHRISESGLKQENPTLFVWDIRHIDTCRRFNVICDEQRELAASMLKQLLLELPTKGLASDAFVCPAPRLLDRRR